MTTTIIITTRITLWGCIDTEAPDGSDELGNIARVNRYALMST